MTVGQRHVLRCRDMSWCYCILIIYRHLSFLMRLSFDLILCLPTAWPSHICPFYKKKISTDEFKLFAAQTDLILLFCFLFSPFQQRPSKPSSALNPCRNFGFCFVLCMCVLGQHILQQLHVKSNMKKEALKVHHFFCLSVWHPASRTSSVVPSCMKSLRPWYKPSVRP